MRMMTFGDYRPAVAKYLTRESGRSCRPEVARALLELEPDTFGLADGRVIDDAELEALRCELERLRAKPPIVTAQRALPPTALELGNTSLVPPLAAQRLAELHAGRTPAGFSPGLCAQLREAPPAVALFVLAVAG